ncbi:MAG TPA: glycosyltransferase family 2 protein, partial [Flavobacteriales bacterium]|nr:glycosyltransferase family 2 protein [Flavobacteriales bacterium]
MRSELAIPPPPTAILDDLVHSMSIAKRGSRIIYEPQAQAYEHAAASMSDEFRRKKRLALGGFQMLLKRWALPNWHTPRLLFCFISHKILRWMGPWLLLVLWLANALLVGHHWFYSMFFAGQMLFYALAFIGLLVPTSRSWSCFSIPMYFVQMNAAFLLGALQALFAPS